ncbi:SCO family protein [Nocardioides daphniae]|uniref:Electron transporter SenC n=1 Tax=Nocardioides daphniae TaxID=402297 RepID=A0ABQ1Q8H2_9ACTN|nr:SCO family protein [Nocardioides daphniae]GGD18988.1 electron transporter SenC [Nocardioides daphniae]
MTRGWGRRLALGLAAGVLATGALACSPATQEPSEAGIYGAELDQPYEAAAIPLTTTSGEERALADVDNDLTLVFFGYTHCPDICGVVMSTIASALTQVDEELRDRVDMVFVTTDPARDDAEVLRGYLDRYNPEFEGLTGSLDAIVETGRSVSVAVEEGEKLPSGGYEVVHSDHVVGLDEDGLGQIVWTKDVSAKQMASDIESLLSR